MGVLGLAVKAAKAAKKAGKVVEKAALDPSFEARMARARAMGFDVDNPRYVSTLEDTAQFKPHGEFAGHKGLAGISVTDNPEMANRYLDRYGDTRYDGAPFAKNVMKVFIRPGAARDEHWPLWPRPALGSPLPEGYSWPSQFEGVDSVSFPDKVSKRGGVQHLKPDGNYRKGVALSGTETILRDPSRIRAFSAMFDPDEIDSADLLKAKGGHITTLTVKRKVKR